MRLLNVQIAPSVIAGSSTGFKQRQRDVPELLPARGAVDAGRFVEFGGDALHAAQRDDHHEREAEPDVGDDAGRERAERLAEPVDGREMQATCPSSRFTAPYS